MGCGRLFQLDYECVTSSAITRLNTDNTVVGIRFLAGAFAFELFRAHLQCSLLIRGILLWVQIGQSLEVLPA